MTLKHLLLPLSLIPALASGSTLSAEEQSDADAQAEIARVEQNLAFLIGEHRAGMDVQAMIADNNAERQEQNPIAGNSAEGKEIELQPTPELAAAREQLAIVEFIFSFLTDINKRAKASSVNIRPELKELAEHGFSHGSVGRVLEHIAASNDIKTEFDRLSRSLGIVLKLNNYTALARQFLPRCIAITAGAKSFVTADKHSLLWSSMSCEQTMHILAEALEQFPVDNLDCDAFAKSKIASMDAERTKNLGILLSMKSDPRSVVHKLSRSLLECMPSNPEHLMQLKKFVAEQCSPVNYRGEREQLKVYLPPVLVNIIEEYARYAMSAEMMQHVLAMKPPVAAQQSNNNTNKCCCSIS